MTDRQLLARLSERAVGGRWTTLLGLGGLLALAGLGLFVLNARGAGADRAWQLFHVNWLYFTGLATGSVALSAVQRTTRAKWGGVIVRFAEASAAFLPLSIVGLVLIFTVGYEHIYGPMQHQLETLAHGKAVWLSRPWMFTRLFVSLVALTVVAWRFLWTDLQGDVAATAGVVGADRQARYARWAQGHDEARNDERGFVLAPLCLVRYAVTLTRVGFVGIMALQPHWFSNLLGGFYFMGSFLGGHTLLALMMMYGAAHLGVGDLVSPKQRHDLGKMCLGFTVFWAYLMWAQFLVIWYGNMPEETGFVFARLWGHWMPVGRLVLLGMFVIPFIGLLGVAPKKFPGTLALFTGISLVSLWLERYLLVVPSVTTADGPVIGMPELAPTLLLTGLFLLGWAWFGRTFPMLSPRRALVTLVSERGHGHGHEYDHEESPKDFAMPAELERRGHKR